MNFNELDCILQDYFSGKYIGILADVGFEDRSDHRLKRMLPGATTLTRIPRSGGSEMAALGFRERLSAKEREQLFDVLEAYFDDVIPNRDDCQNIWLQKEIEHDEAAISAHLAELEQKATAE